jgi:hypothetical protein
MRRNLFKTAIASLLFAVVLLGGYSCSDDDPYYPDDYLTEAQVRRMIEEALRQNNEDIEVNFTKWEILPYTVSVDDWEWKENAGRYEAIYDLSKLTEFIYENGAVLGYVFIGQQGVDEVQKLLPYVHTYPITDANGNITATYTETISFDVQFAPNEKSTVAFFIQASDLFRADEYLDNYNFRLVLIW